MKEEIHKGEIQALMFTGNALRFQTVLLLLAFQLIYGNLGYNLNGFIKATNLGHNFKIVFLWIKNSETFVPFFSFGG